MAPRVSLASCIRALTISSRSLSAPILSILRNLTLAASNLRLRGSRTTALIGIVKKIQETASVWRHLMGVRSFVFRML